jgi:pimeloyl-ACP methyl ester carboxylesterase
LGATETIVIVVLAAALAAVILLAMRARSKVAAIARRHARVGVDLEIDGGTLNVVEIGTRRSGPCFVLLHGDGAHHEDMRVSIGERLAREGRVILVDRPGHGWSTSLGDGDGATPESQAIAIAEALGQLGVASPIIVGHDVGGTVALAYALSYPEDIGGIVVISPVSHPDGIRPTLGQRLVGIPGLGAVLSWLFVPVFGGVSQRRRLAQAFAPQRVPADYYDAVGAELALRPAAWRAAAAERLALPDFLEEQSKYYGEIHVPVVVMAGEEDRVTDPRRHASRLAHDVPGGRWVVLNDVGHMAHHVSPNVILFEINRLADQLWSSNLVE